MAAELLPYTVIADMKNGDIIIYHVRAESPTYARLAVYDLYDENGWDYRDMRDLNAYVVRKSNRRAVHIVRQIAACREEVPHE